MVENLQREDLNAIDKAGAFRDYLSRYGGTQEELAGRLGIDRSTVSNLIRLLELPDEILDAVRSNQISQGHARALLGLEDAETRLDRLPPGHRRAPLGPPDRGPRQHGRAHPEPAQSAQGPGTRPGCQASPSPRPRTGAPPPLRDHRGRPRPTPERGQIVIDYHSREEFDRLSRFFGVEVGSSETPRNFPRPATPERSSSIGPSPGLHSADASSGLSLGHPDRRSEHRTARPHFPFFLPGEPSENPSSRFGRVPFRRARCDRLLRGLSVRFATFRQSPCRFGILFANRHPLRIWRPNEIGTRPAPIAGASAKSANRSETATMSPRPHEGPAEEGLSSSFLRVVHDPERVECLRTAAEWILPSMPQLAQRDQDEPLPLPPRGPGAVPDCWGDLESIYHAGRAPLRSSPDDLPAHDAHDGPVPAGRADRTDHVPKWRSWFEIEGPVHPSSIPPIAEVTGDFDPAQLGVGLDAMADWRAEAGDSTGHDPDRLGRARRLDRGPAGRRSRSRAIRPLRSTPGRMDSPACRRGTRRPSRRCPGRCPCSARIVAAHGGRLQYSPAIRRLGVRAPMAAVPAGRPLRRSLTATSRAA